MSERNPFEEEYRIVRDCSWYIDSALALANTEQLKAADDIIRSLGEACTCCEDAINAKGFYVGDCYYHYGRAHHYLAVVYNALFERDRALLERDRWDHAPPSESEKVAIERRLFDYGRNVRSHIEKAREALKMAAELDPNILKPYMRVYNAYLRKSGQRGFFPTFSDLK